MKNPHRCGLHQHLTILQASYGCVHAVHKVSIPNRRMHARRPAGFFTLARFSSLLHIGSVWGTDWCLGAWSAAPRRPQRLRAKSASSQVGFEPRALRAMSGYILFSDSRMQEIDGQPPPGSGSMQGWRQIRYDVTELVVRDTRRAVFLRSRA